MVFCGFSHGLVVRCGRSGGSDPDHSLEFVVEDRRRPSASVFEDFTEEVRWFSQERDQHLVQIQEEIEQRQQQRQDSGKICVSREDRPIGQ